ncbi:hypothetical protein RUM43_001211 [Polyplax serrata]|uniref:Uncharacterized protein n=1 Tax=Polyplax serrata TaxID=468196 RepID=A0AAN8XQA1_POLSC
MGDEETTDSGGQEEKSGLIWSVWSVINRSPRHKLKRPPEDHGADARNPPGLVDFPSTQRTTLEASYHFPKAVARSFIGDSFLEKLCFLSYFQYRAVDKVFGSPEVHASDYCVRAVLPKYDLADEVSK